MTGATGAPPHLRSAVAGWGFAVPEGRLTNADLEARGLGTTDQWIFERTGIRERRITGPGETTASLGVAAGNAALKSAGITPGDLSMVIVATCTPEQPIPETSAFVADGLGVRCGAFDVGGACAGFCYALTVADGLLQASRGALGPLLVVGAENLTRVIDPMDRSMAILFGDGAGALVLVPSDGVAMGKLAQALAYGARTLLVRGDFDDCLRLVEEASTRLGVYLLNSITPFRLEGQKTIVLELLQQLQWQPPDW
ncbi:MAG: pyridoxal-phosphate dependent enzyme, partial [Acidimicrobiia bacterium]